MLLDGSEKFCAFLSNYYVSQKESRISLIEPYIRKMISM